MVRSENALCWEYEMGGTAPKKDEEEEEALRCNGEEARCSSFLDRNGGQVHLYVKATQGERCRDVKSRTEGPWGPIPPTTAEKRGRAVAEDHAVTTHSPEWMEEHKRPHKEPTNMH